MIFIAGVNEKEKELEYEKMIICPNCGELTNIRILKSYCNLSLFFIPTVSWDKKYYVLINCCDKTFSIPVEIGEKIEKGMDIEIEQSDLIEEKINVLKTCKYCNYALEEGFTYCPNCGVKINGD